MELGFKVPNSLCKMYAPGPGVPKRFKSVTFSLTLSWKLGRKNCSTKLSLAHWNNFLEAWVLICTQNITIIDRVCVTRVIGGRIWVAQRMSMCILKALTLCWGPNACFRTPIELNRERLNDISENLLNSWEGIFSKAVNPKKFVLSWTWYLFFLCNLLRF